MRAVRVRWWPRAPLTTRVTRVSELRIRYVHTHSHSHAYQRRPDNIQCPRQQLGNPHAQSDAPRPRPDNPICSKIYIRRTPAHNMMWVRCPAKSAPTKIIAIGRTGARHSVRDRMQRATLSLVDMDLNAPLVHVTLAGSRHRIVCNHYWISYSRNRKCRENRISFNIVFRFTSKLHATESTHRHEQTHTKRSNGSTSTCCTKTKTISFRSTQPSKAPQPQQRPLFGAAYTCCVNINHRNHRQL